MVLGLFAGTAVAGNANNPGNSGPPDTPGLPAAPGAPATPGAADAAWLAARKLDYLTTATTSFIPSDPVNVLAHLQRSRWQPSYHLSPHAVPRDAWNEVFARMATLQDTRDFDALTLLNILLRFEHDELLAVGLGGATQQALLDFKHWYLEPTPLGLRDESWYWSENHVIIYHTVEYLLGQKLPSEIFGNDGRTGAAHVATVLPRIKSWLQARLRFGFSEWHSNVYYAKDLIALVTLVDYAQDPEVRTLAAGVLDTLLFDLALHQQRATFGVTHGRSYKAGKTGGPDEGTWNVAKMLFDDTTYPYRSDSDQAGVLMAASEGYALPEAIVRVAHASVTYVDRERLGIPVKETGPVTASPVAPYGLSFTDPESLSLWWGMGALTAWPVVPLTLDTMNAHDLWSNHFFAGYIGFQPLATNVGLAQQVAAGYWPFLNQTILQQVNTYTWHSPDVMLSSALSYRPGVASQQTSGWQATLDAYATVFTTHPFRGPVPSTVWKDDVETGGYWVGDATSPRSAQHENVAIHIYAPQYPQNNAPPVASFHWENYTHAYFPQDGFDEVVQSGGWTLGRKGNGYLALYSWRPAAFVSYDPAVYATRGMTRPFDLVASGGADNVWIVECGRAATWGTFEAFTAAITASDVSVVSRGPGPGNGISRGFDVTYTSPSQGVLAFGWTGPFTVAGQAEPLSGFLRYDNPFSQTAFDAATISFNAEGYGAATDLSPARRVLTAP